MKQTVAATLYTLREQVKTKEGFTGTLQKLKETGFDTVQYSAVAAPLAAREVRDICGGLGISICCSHVPWERLKNDLDALANEQLAMGCPIVGIGSYPGSKLSSGEDTKTFIREIKTVSKMLRPYGLKFAVHNHWNEFHRWGGKTVLQLLAEQTDPEETEIIFCCYWAQHAGADPVQCLYELKGRVTCCHYKEKTMLNGEITQTEVGSGNMNYPAIFKACEETGVKYAIVENDVCHIDPFESVKISREYILGLGKREGLGHE
jgi:sugar phosphate isomerase/epimerase